MFQFDKMDELNEETNCEASPAPSQEGGPERKEVSGDELSSDDGDTKTPKRDKETPSKDVEQKDQGNVAQVERRRSQRQSVIRNKSVNDVARRTKSRKAVCKEKEDTQSYRYKHEERDNDDDEGSEEEEQKWEIVTPEMIMQTLGRNSHWRSTSTTEEIVSYLRLNYPVSQSHEKLTMEVVDKLTCAEEIGLVIRTVVSDKKDAERPINTYRLASPLEKTFLSEWEVKEFWSHYREILRRSRRQQKARHAARATRMRRNGASSSRSNRRRTNPRKYRRRRATYSPYTSEDDSSGECGKDCCCRK